MTETYTYADDLQRTHYSNAVITFTGECSADTETYVYYFAHFNGHSQIVEWTINDGNLRYYLMTKEFTDINSWCKGSGKCHGCGGDGLWLGNAEKCDYCEGSGVCEHCNGTGILEY